MQTVTLLVRVLRHLNHHAAHALPAERGNTRKRAREGLCERALKARARLAPAPRPSDA
jgi:imidazolonepropionase-like amidohydrolase